MVCWEEKEEIRTVLKGGVLGITVGLGCERGAERDAFELGAQPVTSIRTTFQPDKDHEPTISYARHG